MARYKPQDRNSLLLPVVLSEQIVPGSFAFALDYLVDSELDLSALDARFKNDEVGASAYDPRVMLKIVLLAYSHGLISSRAIEQAGAKLRHTSSMSAQLLKTDPRNVQSQIEVRGGRVFLQPR